MTYTLLKHSGKVLSALLDRLGGSNGGGPGCEDDLRRCQ